MVLPAYSEYLVRILIVLKEKFPYVYSPEGENDDDNPFNHREYIRREVLSSSLRQIICLSVRRNKFRMSFIERK